MTAVALAILVVVISILIFCSALFSGVETALFSLKAHQLRRLETNHARLTKFVQSFRENPRRVLNVLLLGDALVNVLLVVLCLLFLWEGPLAGRISQWAAGLAIFAIIVLLCDLIPKLLALSAPYRLSTIGAFALQISMPVLDRIGRGLENVSAYVVDLLTPSHLRTRARLSDEELETLIEMSEEEGALYEGEAEIIQELPNQRSTIPSVMQCDGNRSLRQPEFLERRGAGDVRSPVLLVTKPDLVLVRVQAREDRGARRAAGRRGREEIWELHA